MSSTTGQVQASSDYRGMIRDVVWKLSGSNLKANGILFAPTYDSSITTIDLSGVQQLRIADLGLEPNIRTSKPMRIPMGFRRVTKATLDRFMIIKEFNQTSSIEVGIFDTTAGVMTAATGLSNYSDYEWWFGAYRGWKTGTVTIYVNDVAKDPADATYGYTLFLDDGGLQATTPANWSGVTVTATFTWAPTIMVNDVRPNPVAGTYPQFFDVEVDAQEIVGLYG